MAKRPVLAVVAAAALLLGACSQSGAGTTSSSGSGAKTVPAAVTTHQFSWGSFKLADRVATKLRNGEPVNIVVGNQGTAIPVFGAQQKAGVEQACGEAKSRLPVECRLVGPVSTNQSQQLAELETLLTSGQVDCLGVQSPQPDAFVNIIDKYVAAGVPVFTENTDVPNSKRFAFYALNEKAAGVANGKTTGELMKAKGMNPDEVAVGSGNPNGPWAKDRMAGFEEGFKQVFPDAKFFNGPDNGLPTGEDFTTQEVVDSVGPFLSANPKVNLFFHTDQGVEGVSTVIDRKGLSGKVWTSGFNVSGPILDGVAAGRVLSTIDQGFDKQAGAVVKGCTDYLTTGAVPADPLAYLEPIIVTKDGANGTQSVDDARKRLAAATTK